jgi:ectoine hydroxylase-related dioxygenase (phytanoyl-CoA dioxygenase family)
MKYKDFYEKGFQIFPNIISKKEATFYQEKINKVYNKQVAEFGLDNIVAIGEENTVRSPFLYDKSFINLFYSHFCNKIIEDILGPHAILSLQNAIFMHSNTKHHQSVYHRDIIHQNFTSSSPLAVNIYYCLSDYDSKTGGTSFIPYSHTREIMNNNVENIEITPEARQGSVILFNSMIFHKAGENSSNETRYGVNNMYTLPFLKQQINYPYVLKKTTNDDKLNQLLGFKSREYLSVHDFRSYRLNRIKNVQ